MNASDSFDNDGEIISYTFRIEDLNGDTVAGPLTTFDVPEQSVNSVVLPKGSYIAFLTVMDNNGATDTAEVAISHDSDVVFGTASTSVSALKEMPGVQAGKLEGNDHTCSRFPGDSLITCVLGTGTSSVNIVDDILPIAQIIDSNIPDGGTIVSIQAWGAKGGNGADIALKDGGGGGLGGFAQTTLLLLFFQPPPAGMITIFYYLGVAGSHDHDLGGQGGTSTLVTFKNLENTSTSDLNLDNDVILIAGGGGGGGGAVLLHDGQVASNGGTAIATPQSSVAIGPAAAIAVAMAVMSAANARAAAILARVLGVQAGNNDSTAGSSGIGGKGGQPQGFDFLNDRWLNGTPNVGGNGQGGNAGSQTTGGGGGGGFGGGGGEGGDPNAPGIFTDCDPGGSDCSGYGGCGGGSYANISFTFGFAINPSGIGPTSFVPNTDVADGEVRIVFNP